MRLMGTELPGEGGLTRLLTSGVWPSRGHSWLSISSQGSPLLPPSMIWVTLTAWCQTPSPGCGCLLGLCSCSLDPGMLVRLEKNIARDKSNVLEMQKYGVWTISLWNCCRKGGWRQKREPAGWAGCIHSYSGSSLKKRSLPWRQPSFPFAISPFCIWCTQCFHGLQIFLTCWRRRWYYKLLWLILSKDRRTSR